MPDSPIPPWPADDERPTFPPPVSPSSHAVCWDTEYVYTCDEFGVSSQPNWKRYPLATAPAWVREMFWRLTT